MEEKNALDEWYIRHASFKLDAIIVLRTIGMLLAGEQRDESAIAAALDEKAKEEAPGETVSLEPEIKNAPSAADTPGAPNAPTLPSLPSALINRAEAVSS